MAVFARLSHVYDARVGSVVLLTALFFYISGTLVKHASDRLLSATTPACKRLAFVAALNLLLVVVGPRGFWTRRRTPLDWVGARCLGLFIPSNKDTHVQRAMGTVARSTGKRMVCTMFGIIVQASRGGTPTRARPWGMIGTHPSFVSSAFDVDLVDPPRCHKLRPAVRIFWSARRMG